MDADERSRVDKLEAQIKEHKQRTDERIAHLQERLRAVRQERREAEADALAQLLPVDRRTILSLLAGGMTAGAIISQFGPAQAATGVSGDFTLDVLNANEIDGDGSSVLVGDNLDFQGSHLITGLTEVQDSTGTAVLGESVASGSVTLSSGTATVDTGVSESTTATFFVAIGPDTDDAEIAASIDANSGGNYEVHLDEVNTSVGNPTVRYDIVRVR